MRLRWLPTAVEDLTDISHYLSLHNPSLRRSTMIEIYKGIGSIAAMPYRGKPGKLEGTREMVFPRLPYIAAYRIRHETIEVIFIRHAAQRPQTT